MENKKFKLKFWLVVLLFVIVAVACAYAGWLSFAAVFGPQYMFIGVGVGYALPIICAIALICLLAFKGKHVYLDEKSTCNVILKSLLTAFIIALVHAVLLFLPIYYLLARTVDLMYFATWYRAILDSFAVTFIVLSIGLLIAWSIAKKNQRSEEIAEDESDF